MNTTHFEEANLQALLEKIARDEGFEHPTYSIGNASKPGQNFIGRLFRVLITENQDGKEKSLSLVFKASSTNRARQDMLGGDMAFRIEKNVYEIVFPTLNDFLKKHGVANHRNFPGTPWCYATELNYSTSTDKSDIIVLEDLKAKGFEVVSFHTGLSGEQCRLALERVALLHATSMALHELEPETADRLGMLIHRNQEVEHFNGVMEDLKQGYIAGLELLEDPYVPGNPTYETLQKFKDDFADEFKLRFDLSGLNFAITHSDLSANNLMFKINKDGSTEDACLIDFQTAAVSNVTNDLATLLFFCTTKQTRDEHLQNLLKFYHEEVTRLLRAFGCDPEKVFPWDLYEKSLKKTARVGIILSLFALPVVMADISDYKGDIHSEDTTTVFPDMAAANPETVKRMKQRIHDVVSDGVSLGYL